MTCSDAGTGTRLGQDRHPAPGRGRREGPEHLGRERRLHRLPGRPARGRGGEKAGNRTGCGPTVRTIPARTASTCADAISGRPLRSQQTESVTARGSAPEAVGRRSSTGPTTASATRMSAGSTASSVTGPWPRDTTSLPSATRRPCWWRSATSGCDQRVSCRPQSVGVGTAQTSAIAACPSRTDEPR